MHWSWKRPSIPKSYKKWLKINAWWLWIVFGIVLALVIWILFKADNWASWTGFTETTLWDWLKLLIVPISLSIFAFFLQQQQQKKALNEEKEEILQKYFDRLSDLLINQNLLAIATKVYPVSEDEDDEDDEVLEKSVASPEEQELFNAAINIIRAQTISTLRRFENDSIKKTSIILFLVETEIIYKTKIKLNFIDLRNANLSHMNLKGVTLYASILSDAKLKHTVFYSADLRGADLRFADLHGADLRFADLCGADLRGANLCGTDLCAADLEKVQLSNTDLRDIKWSKNPEWLEETEWPSPEEVAKAKNIPEKLKQQLGIE